MAKGNRTNSGGGINSRVNVTKPVRTGQPATKISPKGVSQYGSSIGNHATDSGRMLRGGVETPHLGPMSGPGSVKLGNEVAMNVGGGGPGSGRVLYGQSGTNQQYGKPEGTVRPPGRGFDERGKR
jgi:hypothetical protein